MGQALQGALPSESATALQTAVADEMWQYIEDTAASGGTVDLSNSTQLTTVLTNSVDNLQTQNPELDVQAVTDNQDDLVQVMAATNTQIIEAASNSDATTAITEIYQAREVGINSVAEDIQAATAGTKPITEVVNENTGENLSTQVEEAIVFIDPIAVDDHFTLTKDQILTGNVFADNGAGPDEDINGLSFNVVQVNGDTADVGQAITLDSGAILTLNSNGNFSYEPATSSLTDSFTYQISNSENLTDSATVNLEILDNIIGETGTIEALNMGWTSVTLQNTYINPVVLALPLSNNGWEPATVRLRNINSNSFDILLQEPSQNVSPGHINESLHYLVVEAGTWQLPDGAILEAGNTEATGIVNFTNKWFDVDLGDTFSETPVILSHIQTTNGWDYVNTRTKQLSATGFKVGMEEEEAKANSGHVPETIGYMAISDDGTGEWGDIDYVTGSTLEEVTNAWHNLDLGNVFSATPNFVAALASYNGRDPANLRYRIVDENIQIKVAEEQSLDNELAHIPEQINYLAFSGDGNLIGEALV